MAVQAVQLYNTAKLRLYISTPAAQAINWDTDTIRMALFTSASNAATLSNTDFGDLTNEVSGNGYTAGGETLANTSITLVGDTVEFRSDPVTFNATGGNIVARFAVIYSDTPADNSVIGVFLLDDTPGDVTITDGIPFELRPETGTAWFVDDIQNP